MNAIHRTSQSIRFRGRSFLATVLEPIRPIEDWLTALDQWLERSSGFFAGRPVLLDVAGTVENGDELRALVKQIEKRGVRILGIDGADAGWLGPDLPPKVAGGRNAGAVEMVPQKAQKARAMPGLLIDKPIRSGQSVLFEQGDVTVIGSVASGAEIVAGGSIHVYGSLRGRAIAGTTGNSTARIFCRRYEAELLAIDGLYKTAEDIGPDLRGKAVQAWLDGNSMKTSILE